MPNLVNTFYKPYRASLTQRPAQATVVAKTGAAIKNNGGTLFYGGTTVDGISPAITTYPVADLSIRTGFNGSVPYLIADENIGTSKAIAAGTFATMEAGQYILFGYTKKVAGVANTRLTIQGNPGAGSPGEYRALSYVRTTHYILGPSANAPGYEYGTNTGGYDYVTGFPTAVFGAVGYLPISQDFVGVSPSGYAGSYQVPGRLTFFPTGKTPTVISYQSPKTD